MYEANTKPQQTSSGKRRTAASVRSNAFTLVELLVVIAIIGVLVALLLPAVQAAREAARRSQCTNNLKQIGLALQLHHDAKSLFPPGWDYQVFTGEFGNGSNRGVGWAVYCLPYIEQSALHDQIMELVGDPSDRSYPPNPGIWGLPEEIKKTVLTAYLCPSDPSERIVQNVMTVPPPILTEAGKNSYVAVSGTFPSWIGQTITLLTSEIPRDIYSRGHIDRPSDLGLFHAGSMRRLKQVTDGTSNTFAIGERYWDGKPVTSSGIDWAPSAGATWLGSNNIFWGTTSVTADAFTPMNSPLTGLDMSSLHPGGANFLFVDGSVHFLGESINLETYQGLSTIAGEEIVAQ